MPFALETAFAVREREDGLLEKDTFDLSNAVPVEEAIPQVPETKVVAKPNWLLETFKTVKENVAPYITNPKEKVYTGRSMIVKEKDVPKDLKPYAQPAPNRPGWFEIPEQQARWEVAVEVAANVALITYGAKQLVGMVKNELGIRKLARDMAVKSQQFADEFVKVNESNTVNKVVTEYEGKVLKGREALRNLYQQKAMQNLSAIEVESGKVQTVAEGKIKEFNLAKLFAEELKVFNTKLGETGEALIKRPKVGDIVTFEKAGEILTGPIQSIVGNTATINMGTTAPAIVTTLDKLSVPKVTQPTEGKVDTSLYHETSISSLRDLMSLGDASGLNVSDNPDLALGQTGKGVKIEFDKAKLLGDRGHLGKIKKPGLPVSESMGMGTEYRLIGGQTGINKISKITIESGIKMDKVTKAILQRQFDSKKLENGNWEFTPKLSTPTGEGQKVMTTKSIGGLEVGESTALSVDDVEYKDVKNLDKSQYEIEKIDRGVVVTKLSGEGQKPPVEPPKTAVSEPPLPPTPPPTEQGQPEMPSGDPVQKVIDALKGAKDIRSQQETLYHKARKEKLAKMLAVGEKVKGEKGFFSEKGALKGELPKVEFESIRKNLSQGDIDSLFDMVKTSPHLSPWDKLSAREGLANLLGATGGKVPTEGELKHLHKVFGKELTDVILEKRPLLEKMKDLGLQIANFPRTVMASFDLSYGLRQGAFAAPKYRKAWFDSFKKQFSWFASEKAFQENQKLISEQPNYTLAVESGVSFTEMDSLMSEREERFASQWAEFIPGVRASARAYTGFANKLRMDMFDILVQDAEKLGLKPQENRDLSKGIAEFVNLVTGRGPLGEFERASTLLNSFFFSPRLMASRTTLLGINPFSGGPAYYIKQTPFVRKEALKSWLYFLGAGVTILGLAKLGGADVGIDPRSSDFGKIKIGATRIDTWGGFQQYIRMLGQVISGQYKSSTTGKVMTLGEGYRPLTRLEILQRQIESKEAPVFSFITELLKGQDYQGKKINITKEVALRFVPMLVQDLYDIVKDNPEAIPAILLAPFGIGIQTYKPKGLSSGNMLSSGSKLKSGSMTEQ